MAGPVPWWLDEAPPDPEAETLAGDEEADVAVVGGGYTGLWTALALKRRDPSLRVTVLEAEHIGYGPSGRNGGFYETYWCALARLLSRIGDEAALTLAAASEGAFDAVQGLGEDVWLRKGGMLEVSTTRTQDEAVDDAVRAAADLGVPERCRCRAPSSPSDARRRRTAAGSGFRTRPPSSLRGSFARSGGRRSPKACSCTSGLPRPRSGRGSWRRRGAVCARPRSSSPRTLG